MRIMKFIGVAAFLCSCTVYADPQHPKGRIVLDQSQDVFFEQFSPSTYSLQILQAKKQFDHADLILGGLLQLDFQNWHGDRVETTPPGFYGAGNGFYFTQATGDVMENVSSWATTFFSLAESHIGRNDPNGDYVYLPHAFILLGNLDALPFFLTFGINSIPFGVFSGSGPWDTPLTTAYFDPTQSPQLSLGYNKNGWNADATMYSDEVNHDNHFVYNFFYNKDSDNYSYTIGAGYLTDLKTNSTGNPTVSKNQRVSLLGDNLGAVVDWNASVTYLLFSLSGEYTFGHKKVGLNDDKPKAYAVALNYTPNIAGKDTTFGLGHSKAFKLRRIETPFPGYDNLLQSLSGLNNSWALSVSRPLTKNNFVLGLEFEKSTTFFERNTYTTTLDLMTYL